MRVAVCAPQVPFVRGGAELMAEELVTRPPRRERHELYPAEAAAARYAAAYERVLGSR